jgi:nucleotide-binding universal stress UspA family protein
MTDPITVGVDGSPESRAALAWAAREAVRRGLPLRVVYAWQWAPHELIGGGDRDEQAGWARGLVQDAARTVADRHTGLPVTAEILDGAAVDSLLAAVAESGTLVLGSRGHGTIVASCSVPSDSR